MTRRHLALSGTLRTACGRRVYRARTTLDRSAVTCARCRGTRAFRGVPTPDPVVHLSIGPRHAVCGQTSGVHTPLPGDVTCGRCRLSRDFPAPRDWYISVFDRRSNVPGDGTVRLAAGPYRAHADALALVSRAKTLAATRDPFSVFLAWGTCSLPVGTPISRVLPLTALLARPEAP